MYSRYPRKFSEQSKSKPSTRASVEVALLGCWIFLMLSPQSSASTGSGSSGSPQSNWSNTDPNSAVHKNVARSRDLNSSSTDIAPLTPGSHNIALDLGQVFLMGDLNKYSDSLGTQLHYTYGVSDLLAFDSSLGYSQHSNGQFSMITALTGVRLNLSWYDKIIPYAVAGLGFYRPSYQDNTGGGSTNNTNGFGQSNGAPNVSAILFGLHLGPGIDLELSRNMFFGAAVTFHSMFGNKQTWSNGNTLNVGGTYTSFFLHIGASF